MTKIKILLENALVHKEKIEPNILNAITNKSHYLADNSAYPQMIGRGNFLLDSSNKHFNKCLGKIKRSHNATDITPEKYFELKKTIGTVLYNITKIEEEHKTELNQLAETIIRNYFNVPNDIQFELSDDGFNVELGDEVLKGLETPQQQVQFDDHSYIENANNQIDRSRTNYALICGGSNQAMELFKSYENALDSIDYRLFDLYQKFISFNHFNLWVTPDEVLSDEVQNNNDFKIYQKGDGYVIAIEPNNFLMTLYEMSKAVLSILFQEKYDNSYVDYENLWNTRIGTILWQDFIENIKQRKHFPYIVDSMNQLNDSDYLYVMKEVFAKTNHAKEMFADLCDSFNSK
jgi:hypothetical protein